MGFWWSSEVFRRIYELVRNITQMATRKIHKEMNKSTDLYNYLQVLSRPNLKYSECCFSVSVS